MDKHCKKLKEVDHDNQYSSSIGFSRFQCVLPKEVMRPSVPLVDVFVGTLPEKKLISHFITELNRFMPITELIHLKRVKNSKVIICFTAEGTEDNVLLKLSQFKLNLFLANNLEVVSIPKFAPKTRKQFIFSNEIWPTYFHENKYLENLISNILFPEYELKYHEKWMQVAVEAARRCDLQRGSVIVNPQKNEAIAVASDSRNSHPLKHSVMVAIDLVARSQGGGAWISHPADFFLLNSIQCCKLGSNKTPYLCTGYYLYTTHEPCIICAMALIHSRVKRVFYGSSSSNGALSTDLNIHLLKNLNHHYEVFKEIR